MSIADFPEQAIRNSAPQYLRGEIDNTVRQWFFLKFLEEAKRIKKNDNSHTINWLVKNRRPQIYTTRGQRPQFVQSDNNTSLTIGRARLEGVDKIDRDTISVNQGPTQIVDLADSKIKGLIQSMTEAIATSLFQDASADDSKIAGLDTIFQGVVSHNNDRVARPSDSATYGGKSMKLGATGGSWSNRLASAARFNSGLTTDWPEGSGDPQYDYLAPKMFNYTGAWQASGNTWKANCEMLMRRATVSINSLGGEGQAPGLHLLARGLYNEFQDSLVGRERLYVSDYAKSLGFADTLQFEGAMIRHDFACPADSGYALNVNHLELSTVTKDALLYIDGPTWSIEEQAYLMLVGFHGNFRYNPKYFCKYGTWTT